MPRPNILLVCADHLRNDALGCNGNPFVHTPNIDRFARSGVTFCNSFSTNPICVPARASVTTGNYPHRATGELGNNGRIRDDQPILAEHFNSAGYATYAVGKLHYVPYSKPGEPRLVHGFQSVDMMEEGRIVSGLAPDPPRGQEEYFDYLSDVGWAGYTRAHGVGNNDVHPAPSPLPAEHFVDQWVARTTIERLEQHTSHRAHEPWLTWMSFPKPHSPYDPPDPYHRFYDPRHIPAPIGSVDDLADKSPELRLRQANYNWSLMSPEAIQVARAHYFGLVTFQDYCFGQVLDYLDETGQRENTIIAYMSDHGDLLGDFGTFFKSNMLNGSVCVPSIWAGPDIEARDTPHTALVGLQDVLPTIASMSSADLNEQVHGCDLSPVLSGQTDSVRDFIVSQTGGSGSRQIMGFDGRWKYIYSEKNGFAELYDELDDPEELHNVAQVAPEQASRLHTRLVDWCRETGYDDMLDGDDMVRTEQIVEPGVFNGGPFGWRWY
jgi:arylsulfatase